MRHVVIDTETTGFEETDQLVEIAAVWRDNGDLCQIHDLCRPSIPIPPEAKAVHHITEDMVRDKVIPMMLYDRVAAHAGFYRLHTVMVAHNAEFDRGFLTRLEPRIAEVPWICTWRSAMHIWPEAPGHSNQVLRYWLDLDIDLPSNLYPHRALYDTIVTEAILQRMLERHTYDELIRLTLEPVLLKKVNFGKHKGMEWKDLPKDYLRWVLKQEDMDSDRKYTARYWLNPQGRLL